MAEERKLPLEVELKLDRAEQQLEQLENRGFQPRSALNPNRAVQPQAGATQEQQRLADRFDTAYENRLLQDRQRTQRQQDSVHERVERNWDLSNLSKQRADERAATNNVQRVERSWDQSQFAAQRIENRNNARAIERAERDTANEAEAADVRGIQREADEFYRASGGGDEGGGSVANRMRSGGPPRGRGQPQKRFLGLRTGRLYQYLGVGFIAREALNAAQAGQQLNTNLALAEQSGDPMGATNAWMQATQAIEQIPIFGQIAGLAAWIPGKNAALAKQAAQMSMVSVQSMVQETQESSLAQLGLRSAFRKSSAANITSGAERQEAGVNAELANLRDERNTQYQNMVLEANMDPNSFQKQIKLDRADAFQRASNTELAAKRIEATAEITQIRRDVDLKNAGEYGRRGSLNLAAQSKMGEAEEAQFSADLMQSAREAYSQSEALGDTVVANNEIRRAARREENTERTRRYASAGRITAALLNRRRDEAELEQSREDRRLALREARTDEERNQINSNYDAQEKLITRNASEQRELTKQNLQNQLTVQQSLAQGKEKTAEAQSISGDTLAQAQEVLRRGGPDAQQNYRTIIQTGIAREQAYQRQLQFQLYGGSFGPNNIAEGGIGPGALASRPREERPEEGMKNVEKAIKDLQAALLGSGS